MENIFKRTTITLPEGHFQVGLPFSNPNDYLQLGESFNKAYKRHLNLQRSFSSNKVLLADYKAFTLKYIQNRYAEEVSLTFKN